MGAVILYFSNCDACVCTATESAECSQGVVGGGCSADASSAWYPRPAQECRCAADVHARPPLRHNAWPIGTPVLQHPAALQIYNLPVTVVPPNRTVSRTDNPDVVFRCACLLSFLLRDLLSWLPLARTCLQLPWPLPLALPLSAWEAESCSCLRR